MAREGITRREMLRVASALAGWGLCPYPTALVGQVGSWGGRKRRARVKGLEMAYFEVGQGDPILFLHGNPTSSYLWRNVIPHVQHLGRCIAPDMIGMGDSDPLPDSGPGKYTFVVQRDYLFELFERLEVGDRVTLVVHDWGGGVGFSWAQRYPARVRGIAYAESVVRRPDRPRPAVTSGPFALLRSGAGEKAVLEDNMFVEELLIGRLGHYLSQQDQAEYRRPFREPGESRRPTLCWPRELPLGGEPKVNDQLIRSYCQWLAGEERIPKLFVRAVPGNIFAEPGLLEFARSLPNQEEVEVYGGHFLQEVSPHAMGRALAAWISGLA